MLLSHLVIVHIHPPQMPPAIINGGGWRDGWKKERQIDLQCQVENEVVTKQCGGEEAREQEEERGLDWSHFHL